MHISGSSGNITAASSSSVEKSPKKESFDEELKQKLSGKKMALQDFDEKSFKSRYRRQGVADHHEIEGELEAILKARHPCPTYTSVLMQGDLKVTYGTFVSYLRGIHLVRTM